MNMQDVTLTTAEHQKFWDEWFERYVGMGDEPEMAGQKADAALAVRRRHRIIPAEELETANVEANRWKMEYQELRDRGLEAGRWVRELVSKAIQREESAKDEAYRLRGVSVERDKLRVENNTLRHAFSAYKWAELNPSAPPERLSAAVTIGDLSAAVNHPGGALVGLVGLMQKWGINLADMIDEEFFSPATGIMRVSDVDPQDSDTRRRLRKYLATGIYVKKVEEDPAE